MNRKQLDSYITEQYGTTPEFLWISQPTYAVYRHRNNNKWFAVIMEIPKSKLCIEQDNKVTVVNLKCDPLLIGALIKERGIFKGYHMNKNYWITVLLDGSVDSERIKWLLNISFNLTFKK